jgi:short-subunit dehydrogenase
MPDVAAGSAARMPNALITGASRGLGAAIARALAPTHTLFLAGRPSSALDELATELGATTWPVDLADPDAIPAVVEPIIELDALIHNAGVAYPGRVAESTVDEWRDTMAVNVIGAVALTLALLPALRNAGGTVVFVNSGSGINASPGLASYSASKFALRGFADSLRNDEPSLRVTSVHPGRIDTEMQEGLVAYEGGSDDPKRFLSPETVAKVIVEAVNAPADSHVHEVIVRPR